MGGKGPLQAIGDAVSDAAGFVGNAAEGAWDGFWGDTAIKDKNTAKEEANNSNEARRKQINDQIANAAAINLKLLNKQKGNQLKEAGKAANDSKLAAARADNVNSSLLGGGDSVFDSNLGTAVDASKGKKTLLGG